jgi:hypothetical protein
MSMQYDVKSAQLDDTESVSGRNRIKGILITSLANGVVDIKDGNGGNTVFGFNAVAAGNVYVAVPGEGILCQTSIYMNTASNASVTVFYG